MLKDSIMWYTSWFDSPYYLILYKDRNLKEAKDFVDYITNYLSLEKGEKVLDLACGKGRHSIYLNTLGFDVIGADLSKNSIQYASQFENDTLKFTVHDMSKPYPEKFSAIFNLFTSFGYFDKETDNLSTLKSIKSGLNKNGVGVIDFMNVDFVIDNLVAEEVKKIDAITFYIKKFYEEGYIYKEIRFTDNDQNFFYTERVKAITLSDFKDFFKKAYINLFDIFGDYKLNKFDKKKSPRLILIFQ